jgi:hypothetical protein
MAGTERSGWLCWKNLHPALQRKTFWSEDLTTLNKPENFIR